MATQKMWAYALGEPYKFERVELDVPGADDVPGAHVLVRTIVGGICGSDLPYFKGFVPPYGTPAPDGRGLLAPPGAPLHEIVGEIVHSKDPELREGQLVVGWASGMNGIAEYVVIRGDNLHAYGDHLEPATAIMLQPLACVIFAVDHIAGIEGATAAVIGQGSIGALFSHVLKAHGAAKVIGVDRIDRSAAAATFGVDEVVTATSDRWAHSLLTDEERPSIVVEAVGHQVGTLTDAINALRHGGQLYYFGIPDDPVYPFPMGTFLRKNLKLISGFTPNEARRGVLARAEEYLKTYPDLAADYLGRPIEFERVEEAFQLAINPRSGQLKVTLEVGS
jgi:threonine dehydrogenase-like Zn-dependent dehydrogenase